MNIADIGRMQSIISYSNIQLDLIDPLMVFRVTPWTILFPFLSALKNSLLLHEVDEVRTLVIDVSLCL
jgi:hypothetical protein